MQDLADSVAGPVGRPLDPPGNTLSTATGSPHLPRATQVGCPALATRQLLARRNPLPSAAFLFPPTADLSRKFSLLPSAIVPETEAVNALHALTCLHFPIRAVLPENTLLSFLWSGAQLALMVPRTEFEPSYEFTKVNELILVLFRR